MKLEDLDYELPAELIAQEPLAERDASRLLVLDRKTGAVAHHRFAEIAELLAPGDVLVVNDAKVIAARLAGKKVDSGGKAELLVVGPATPAPAGAGTWRCLGQASKPLRPGMRLAFGHLVAEVVRAAGQGEFEVRFDTADLFADLERVGLVPLPPYIKRAPVPADRDRYQTTFARVPGAVAAPTAGLHFTSGLLEGLRVRGIERASVTLLVGPGTFVPIRAGNLDAHRMHAERGEIPEGTVKAIESARARGGRVVAVGTTVVRALEGVAAARGLTAGPFVTDLFVRPGHRFAVVDALVTNFHLPRSTLLALVCAFAGRERVLSAYREAARGRYRFYSYGDAMLIL